MAQKGYTTPCEQRHSGWFSRIVRKKQSSSSQKRSPSLRQKNGPIWHEANNSDLNPLSLNQKSSLRRRLRQNNTDFHTGVCKCCGTVLRYPSDVPRIRCMVCQTSYMIEENINECVDICENSAVSLPELSLSTLNKYIKDYEDLQSNGKGTFGTEENKLSSLENFLFVSFSSHKCLNQSFKLTQSGNCSYYSANLNFNELHAFYSALQSLPTARPMISLLKAASILLRHPPQENDVQTIRWLLILMELPTLADSLIGTNDQNSQSQTSLDKCTEPELLIKSISYDILKRIIGISAHFDHKCTRYFSHWWSHLPDSLFIRKIEILNLYITFQLTRCINYEIYSSNSISSSSFKNPYATDDINYKKTLRAHFVRPTSKSSDFGLSIRIPLFISLSGRHLATSNETIAERDGNNHSEKLDDDHVVKLKLQQYCDEWHLRTAATVPEAIFYNNLVDYINVKQDFDSWQFSKNNDKHEKEVAKNNDVSLLMMDYLRAESNSAYLNIVSDDGATLKKAITILEHEAKRKMERKTEEAFIRSVNKKLPFDIYFKIRVRRSFITEDSLRSIKEHRHDFKKSLKIEFVNEPGVDGGGLKKECFFSYYNPSNLCYFSISTVNNEELYYLVGAVLGLAIYNSTILDLKLPRALYKKLLGHKVTLDDFTQLDQNAGKGLKKLLLLENVEELSIYFEVSFKDVEGQLITHELISNGSNVLVNDTNKYEYVERYLNFFLSDICKSRFDSFQRGFYNVVGGNALSLFTPKEIEQILIGDSNEGAIDTMMMRSITRYKGFESNDKVISWFWHYFDSCVPEVQKKILFFVTGTYRLPATGLPSLHFKISRISAEKGCSRLPTSHTCFNELCLSDYESEVEFRNKMEIAINNCEGFELE
ncbi:hypothetical protein HII13_001800 [Brettanomyces bruxellensis]|nr:hypothetical protein HII13_001800 [Brettanomyces bruxellensis]